MDSGVSARLEVDTGHQLTLHGDTIHTRLINRGTVLVAADVPSSVTGLFTNEGDLHVQAIDGADATLTVGVDFSNSGSVLLESAASGHVARLVGGVRFTNFGSVQSVGAGAGANLLEVELDNQGSFDIDKTLSLGTSAAQHENFGTVLIAAGQTLAVTGTSFSNLSVTTIRGSGSFDVRGVSFVNDGALAGGDTLSTGTLTILGDVLMGPNGSINARIGDLGHDRVVVAGDLVLNGNGRLNVGFEPGFVPQVGNSFELVSATNIAGQFAFFVLPPAPPSTLLNPISTATLRSLLVSGVGTTNNWIGAAGGNWDDPLNWSLARVPQAGDDVFIDVPDIAVTILLPAGESYFAAALVSNESLSFLGDTWSVTGSATVNGSLSLQAGSSLFGSSLSAQILQVLNGAGVSVTGSSSIGNLDLAGSMSAAQLTVTDSFVLAATSSLVVSQLNATQALGDLVVNALVTSSGAANLTASSGAIRFTGTGRLVAGSASLNAAAEVEGGTAALDIDTSAANGSISLVAGGSGRIGTLGNPLAVKPGTGALAATTNGADIYFTLPQSFTLGGFFTGPSANNIGVTVTGANSDVLISSLLSTDDALQLSAERDIVFVGAGQILTSSGADLAAGRSVLSGNSILDLQANGLSVVAGGSIGADGNALTVANSGTFFLDANGDIHLAASTAALHLSDITLGATATTRVVEIIATSCKLVLDHDGNFDGDAFPPIYSADRGTGQDNC